MTRRRKIAVSFVAVLVLALGITGVRFAFRFVSIFSPTVPLITDSADFVRRSWTTGPKPDFDTSSLVSEAKRDFSRMNIGDVRFMGASIPEDGRLVFLYFEHDRNEWYNHIYDSWICYVYDPVRKEFVGKFWRGMA